ncbi:Hormone-sensitive lipase [Halotydeus destructor]|nr:Hormone-sensitive lipase [Halotydeus destructor]
MRIGSLLPICKQYLRPMATPKRRRSVCSKNSSASFEQLTKLFESKDDDFVVELTRLHENCCKIRGFYSEYDYTPSVTGNGFRSLVKLVSVYMKNMVTLFNTSIDKRTIVSLQNHKDICPSLNVLLEIALDVRSRDHDLTTIDHPQSQATLDQSLAMKSSFALPFLAHDVANFWLDTSMRRAINQMFIPIIAIKNGPLLKVLTNEQFKNEVVVKYMYNASWQEIRATWAAGEGKLNNLAVKLQFGNKPKIRLEVDIPRQNNYVINEGQIENGGHLIPFAQLKGVRCLLLTDQNLGVAPNDTLIIHIHGGGFISLHPETHEVYLRYWSVMLQTPILSIDYSLSPEAKHPESLQECLDVYLFLTSGDDAVKDAIGFHPKHIILAGDSAGGFLALSLSLALSQVKKLSVKQVPLPSSLVLQYPVSQPNFLGHSASRAMVFVDPVIPLSASLSSSGAYLAGHIDCDTKPWYRDAQVFASVTDMFKAKPRDPYHDILSNQNFADLEQTKLFIQASEFDPLLDDSIAIAKKWKGDVKLDIVENMCHGYLSFSLLSSDARKGCDLSVKRLLEAIEHCKSAD